MDRAGIYSRRLLPCAGASRGCTVRLHCAGCTVRGALRTGLAGLQGAAGGLASQKRLGLDTTARGYLDR